MNIFVLDTNPVIAAKYHCDKHVVKMIVETAQLLSTAHPKDKAPYRHTHLNHPCAVWTRKSSANYLWLAELGNSLISEYEQRYGNKQHATKPIMRWLTENVPDFKANELTNFVRAMPDQYKVDSVVESYRNYYKGDKRRFATWKNSAVPDWFN